MWYIIIALMIWASSFTAGKYAYDYIDPALTVQLRLLIAALIALPLFLRTYHTVPKTSYKPLVLLSFLCFPIGIFVQFMGLNYTSASSAVTIIGTEPLLVLIIGYLFFRQKVAWYDWLLSVIALIGIILLVSGSYASGSVSLLGVALVLAAAIGFVFYIHLSKNMMQTLPPDIYTSFILVVGAILCVPFTLVLTQNWAIPLHIPSLLAVIYLGVGCSWLAYKLWNKGLQKTSAHLSGMLITLEPVIGVVVAMAVLGERMSLIAVIGCILVIGSTILSSIIPILKERRQQKIGE